MKRSLHPYLEWHILAFNEAYEDAKARGFKVGDKVKYDPEKNDNDTYTVVEVLGNHKYLLMGKDNKPFEVDLSERRFALCELVNSKIEERRQEYDRVFRRE